VTVDIEFWVPAFDADGSPVIPCDGSFITSISDARVEAHWVPADSRDLDLDLTLDLSPEDHILVDKCLALQKNVSVVVDQGSQGLTPGDVLEYTIDFQISDYFAFDNLVLSDEFSDGQVLEGVPTLEVADGHGTPNPYGPTDFLIPNFSLATTAGSDTLDLRISAELAARSFSIGGRLVGGAIPDGGIGGGTYVDNPPPYGATRGTVRFRTRVQEEYEADVSPQTQNIDHGDYLSDEVTISAEVLDPVDLSGGTAMTDGDTDDSESWVVVGGLSKSIYAVNGNTSLPPLIQLIAGDQVTYRFQYSLPSSDVEDLELVDFLPQPIFDAMELTTFDPTTSASVPPPGVAKFGPDDTFYGISGIVPAPTNSASESNSVTFDFGDHQDFLNRPSNVDILFTVTVGSAPAANGLFVTNHGESVEESTGGVASRAEASVQVTLSVP